ncbi:MAG: hypothetical protein ACTHK3_06705 [Solirubrobacterales bacterium]
MSQPGAAKTIKELRALSDEELIEQYDQLATHTQVGTSYYEAELGRRGIERQNQLMIRLTWAIAGLTAINAIGVVVSLVK